MKKRTKESSGNAESKIHWQGQGDQAMKDYNYTKKNFLFSYNKNKNCSFDCTFFFYHAH